MKKILPIVIVGILVLSGLGAVAVPNFEVKHESKTQINTISFSEITFEEKEDYLVVDIEETNTESMVGGKPMLPFYQKTFTFTKNAKIKSVRCEVSEITEMTIIKKIQPAPKPIPRSMTEANQKQKITENSKVYESTKLYPDAWFSYTIKSGLNHNDQQSIFVIVEIHPIRYSPQNNILQIIDEAEIQIEYEESGFYPQTRNLENYDLLIIAPAEFETQLQPLIEHKESFGMKTKLVNPDEIITGQSGRDDPEKIKYFIKEEKETYDPLYVLLVGGLKSKIFAKDKEHTNYGVQAWHVPVRYTHIKESEEIGTLSDLYYGDLYKYNETSMELEFEDWDSNGNDIFAEGSMIIGKSDVIDLVPDIYVGRLACRNTREVKTVVNKIINYEKTPPAEKDWFKKMVVIAGKTFDIFEGQPDGEVVCDTALDYMEDLVEPVKLYASQRDEGGATPTPEDIKKAMKDGAGYVNFQGHGNPVRWDTIWEDGEYPVDWCGGIAIYEFWKLLNREKLPVVIVGGCHNGLFNVTLIKTLFSNYLGSDVWYWTHGNPAAECFSWQLVSLPYGGAIASTGCTGYGMGGGHPVSRSAELESNFFYQIGQNDLTNLGAAHSNAITKYINETSLGKTEIFCITVYQLFGDPSLKLGGYEP